MRKIQMENSVRRGTALTILSLGHWCGARASFHLFQVELKETFILSACNHRRSKIFSLSILTFDTILKWFSLKGVEGSFFHFFSIRKFSSNLNNLRPECALKDKERKRQKKRHSNYKKKRNFTHTPPIQRSGEKREQTLSAECGNGKIFNLTVTHRRLRELCRLFLSCFAANEKQKRTWPNAGWFGGLYKFTSAKKAPFSCEAGLFGMVGFVFV